MEDEVQDITFLESLCPTCVFRSKCNIVQFYSAMASEIETEAFKLMPGLLLDMIPNVSICPIYRRDPSITRMGTSQEEDEDNPSN